MARPAFRGGSAHVRVPATSANLGPGFDALALALDLHDDVVAVVGEDGVLIDVAGEGADQVARNEKNLVVSSMRATFDLLGGQPRGIELSCANRIPHGRGLGSSAAAIVAGILLARALVLGGDQALPMTEVLELATRIEGHPDNVAACLLGGLTISWNSTETAHAIRVNLDPSISPFVCVPPTASSTKASRKSLPEQVPHEDAAYNVARAALLVAELSGSVQATYDDPESDNYPMTSVFASVFLDATDDRLHQQYRRTGMNATANLVAALRRSGLPAVISGAGPSVLVFTRTETDVKTATEALPKGWSGSLLGVDRAGARLVPAQR
jgi:homoserine kinase